LRPEDHFIKVQRTDISLKMTDQW